MAVTIDQCCFCKHIKENKGFRMTCDAYPDGIPFDMPDVTKLDECNDGVKFEKQIEAS